MGQYSWKLGRHGSPVVLFFPLVFFLSILLFLSFFLFILKSSILVKSGSRGQTQPRVALIFDREIESANLAKLPPRACKFTLEIGRKHSGKKEVCLGYEATRRGNDAYQRRCGCYARVSVYRDKLHDWTIGWRNRSTFSCAVYLSIPSFIWLPSPFSIDKSIGTCWTC